MPGRLFIVFALATLLATACAAGQTLAEVLAGNLETRGGGAAFSAFDTARLTGTMIMGTESVPMVLELARPDKRRLAFEIQGSWGLQGDDGQTAWEYFPFFGAAETRVLPEDEARQLRRDTDIVEGPLVRSSEKGYTVELEGRERIEGTDAFKLKISSADGSVFFSYLDVDHHLEFKRKGTTKIRGREMHFEVTLGNYKQAGGIYLPHLIQASFQGTSQSQSMRIEQAEIGVELAEDRFSPPSSGTPEGGR